MSDSDGIKNKSLTTTLVSSSGKSGSVPSIKDWDDAETNAHVDLGALAKHISRSNTDSRACLVALVGVDLGAVIPLDRGEVSLGRSSDCDFTLEDDSVSRKHATITATADGLFVINDLNSTNGTFIGDERINSETLRDGDRVVLGKHSVFKFVYQDSMELSYQRLLYESSTRDALTGMYNRKYIEQKLTADLSFAKRHRTPFTFLLLDLDHFKKINDTYGHQTGDLTLTTVAKAILSAIRVEDVLGRYGGEEFAILSLGTNYEGAKRLSERILEQVANSPVYAENGTQISATLSIGAVTVETGVADTYNIISLADDNLYQAKDAGRNCHVCTLFSLES